MKKLIKWIVKKIVESNAVKEAANEYLESIWTNEWFCQFAENHIAAEDMDNEDFYRGMMMGFTLIHEMFID